MALSHYVEDPCLSVAWGIALRKATTRGKEMCPLTVSVTGFNEENVVDEDYTIRHALEEILKNSSELQPVETVANTIFPNSQWNRRAARSKLFERYTSILPKLRKASANNKYGLYFERMITGGPSSHPNQLEHAIAMYKSRKGVRRSALQIATFNPALDHTTAAYRGFPCLQHVTFAPSRGGLNVNAFYATQYMVERAYGNYLGLCRLGAFVAQELDLRFDRFTCLVGVAQVQSKVTKACLRSVHDAVDAVLAGRETAQMEDNS